MTAFPKRFWQSTHRTYWTSLFLATIAAALYTFVVVLEVSMGVTDYSLHAQIAKDMTTGGIVPPHFLYQILLIGIHWLLNFSFTQATYIVVFGTVLATFLIAYRDFAKSHTQASSLWFLAVFVLLFSHPIPLVFPFDHHLYFGYIAANVYHNPTILLLKPIAMVHLILLVMVLQPEAGLKKDSLQIAALALLTGISIITKPNYFIILLPAVVGIYILKRFLLSESTQGWVRVIALGVALPGLILLLAQFSFFYGSGSGNSIEIGLFEVFKMNSKIGTLLPKLVLSIAFPVSVCLLMWRRLVRQVDFQLSVAMLIMSLIFSYGLVDRVAGGGAASGNFWWSAQISHFLLLFVCLKIYVTALLGAKKEYRPKLLIPAYVGGAQLLSGVVWYWSNLYLSNTHFNFW